MEGYRVVFSTLRGRKHGDVYLHEWLINEAKKINADGVTIINATEGYGRDKNLHSAGFFELADQPIEIVVVADETKTDQLFDAIKKAKISLFYTKYKAEFGFTN